MSMKTITLFIAALSSGGAEHQLTILANLLVERGYEVELVTYSDLKDHYPLSEKVKRVRLAEGKANWRKLLRIFGFFLLKKTDCVISFGSRDNMLALLPLLLRPHIEVIVGERCAVYQRPVWYKRLNFKWLYRRANYIVPNSYTQELDIATNYHWLTDKVHVITNYTDVDAYPQSPMPHNDVLKIGIFCRYAEQKNYRRFAEVVKLLKEEEDKPFEIHWYGNMRFGKELLPQYVEFDGLVRKYHIGDRLFLHDHTQQVAQMLPQYDALCLPSLTEGFSNSISEYICTGRPVLASDVADNHVMVKDGTNGFLFDPENIGDMVSKFRRLLKLQGYEYDSMGSASRRIAEGLFNKEKFIESYIKLIEQ